MLVLDIQSLLENAFAALFVIIFVPLILVSAFVLVAGTLAVFLVTAFDIFSRSDLRAGKLIWLLVILFVPLLGALIYWLAKPTDYDPDVALAISRRIQNDSMSVGGSNAAAEAAQRQPSAR